MFHNQEADVQKLEQEAQRLEDEARHFRRLANRKKQQSLQQREQDFREMTGIDVYTSDDYCGLSVGPYWFYYGYEYTVGDGDDAEWAFVAWINDVEIQRIATSDLYPVEGEGPLFYLVAGIGHLLSEAVLRGEA